MQFACLLGLKFFDDFSEGEILLFSERSHLSWSCIERKNSFQKNEQLYSSCLYIIYVNRWDR